MLAIRINITIFAVDIHQIRQCGLNFNIIQPKERLTLSLQQDTNTHNRFMKANWIKSLFFAALVAFSANQAVAQRAYEVPETNPEMKAMAEQVIEMQITDPDGANKVYKKLMGKIKTKKEDLLSIGQFFLDKNVYPCANECAKQLYTVAPEYKEGLMFYGEVCMFRKDYGSAGQKFDEALNVDPNYVPALKRNAFVYKNINPHVAIEMLDRIKAVEPDNHSTDREKGDIYYKLDEYKDAVSCYTTYFKAKTENDSTDIAAAENFLLSLFATQKYMEIGDYSERFLALAPNDLVIKRMKFFADVENYEITKAQESIKYITENQFADSLYVYLDYAYAGNFMSDQDDLASAIKYYELAVKCDSTKLSGLKLVATFYRRNKQYDEGIEMYSKYLKALGDKADLTDQFGLGQQYLAASQQAGITPEKKAEYVAKGDAIFAAIQAEKPDSYQAPMMRAAINITNRNEPEEKVFNFYKEAYKLMEGKENIDSSKLQALGYMAFYCVQKDLEDEARQYTNAILSIDSENGLGKQIDAYLKSINK